MFNTIISENVIVFLLTHPADDASKLPSTQWKADEFSVSFLNSTQEFSTRKQPLILSLRSCFAVVWMRFVPKTHSLTLNATRHCRDGVIIHQFCARAGNRCFRTVLVFVAVPCSRLLLYVLISRDQGKIKSWKRKAVTLKWLTFCWVERVA